jgi:hypothetical protein
MIRLSRDAQDRVTKLRTDILALLPRERVVYFKTNLQMGAARELLTMMPNIETLHFVHTMMYKGFMLPNPNGPTAHTKLLPSLRRLYLERPKAPDHKWDPLVTYLAHQTSGNQAVSLNVFGRGVHICSRLVKQIDGLVEEFIYEPDSEVECPFGSLDE